MTGPALSKGAGNAFLAKRLAPFYVNRLRFVPMKTMFPPIFGCPVLLFALVGLAHAQLAPAGGGTVQVVPGEYFSFDSEGTFTYGSSFTYINYNTKEFDSILTSLSANGTFSGSSPSTGRFVTGQILSSSITMTYNGVTGSAAKLSAYGPLVPLLETGSEAIMIPH